MSRLTQSIHLCFGLPLFLLPGGTISRVFLPTYSLSRLFTWPNHLSLAFLHLSVMFSTFSLSLMSSFVTWYLSVWPQANLHIFISVTSSFFAWELVTDTVSIPCNIAGLTIIFFMTVDMAIKIIDKKGTLPNDKDNTCYVNNMLTLVAFS